MTPTATETQALPHPRRVPKWLATLGAPVAGVIVGLGIGALLILIAGANPLAAYAVMLHGAFGGPRQIEETLLKTAPLLLMGLGLSVAFRARVWNIGGEGQYYIGALVGGTIALTFPGWPRPLLIAAMLIGGVVGGILWAMVAGLLKVRRGMSEIISTLMLNYIAILLVQYVARGPLQQPGGYLPESAQFVQAARMPIVLGDRIHIGVLISLLFIPIVYALLWLTPLGFRLRAVGSRASVARYAGISVEKIILFALAFSGALAGLAGIIEVSSLHTRLKGDISGGYGFSGILVALLGRMHPVGVAVASLFFAALTIGAQTMHIVYGLPDALAGAIQAIVVLCVLAADALVHRR
jgi:general nucleoside transport system permease protein